MLAPIPTRRTTPEQRVDNADRELPPPHNTFPITRPALKPAPEPKLHSLDTHQRGRGRGRGRGQRGRGRNGKANQLTSDDLEDNDPDQVQSVSVAIRRHVKAANKVSTTTGKTAVTTADTTVNTAGEYPLFTMTPTHTKRLRVPSKAFGGQIYKTTARLDAAARVDEGLEVGASKRKGGVSGPSKKK